MSLGQFSKWDPTQKHFGEFLVTKVLPVAAIFAIFMQERSVETNRGKIVLGQNNTFAPVAPQVLEQFSHCPCGVGTYVHLPRHLSIHHSIFN